MGLWDELANRSVAKVGALTDGGFDEAGAGLEVRDREVAWAWWLRERVDRDPDAVDRDELGRSLGFADATALEGAVLREFRFARAGDPRSEGSP